ncbi:MAG: 1-acyl-sn-glycerol-3-phosphate acyltransferase [Sphingobacteriales bacterium]|nr:1-acyl-sn-glycerol-3-phosphate acyltransferase [Sphingobacteriales bacterium]
MIIKPKKLPRPIFLLIGYLLKLLLRLKFKKVVVEMVELKPNHSYLLALNHFSFWDGVWAYHLIWNHLNQQRRINEAYIMVIKKQLQMRPWLRYIGCFSVNRGKASVNESLNYAAEMLSKPGNLLLLFPQGDMESQHIRKILIKEGIANILTQVKGDCQIIWSSNVLEYFESLKPSVYFHLIDAGTNHDFDLESFKEKVNQHHLKAMQKRIRFTQQ